MAENRFTLSLGNNLDFLLLAETGPRPQHARTILPMRDLICSEGAYFYRGSGDPGGWVLITKQGGIYNVRKATTDDVNPGDPFEILGCIDI